MRINSIYRLDNFLIRKPIEEDAEQIFKSYAQDKEVTKYLLWNVHSSLSDTQNFIKYVLDQWKNKCEYHFVICFRETNKPIGMISLKQRTHIVTLGYVLAKQFWGKGIISNVVNFISDTLLKQEDVYRIEAICDIENIGSKKVLEKSGFHCEGILRRYIVHPTVSATPRDVYIFSKEFI